MEKIVLLGCGGHTKSVTDAILRSKEYSIAGFTGLPEDKGFSYAGFEIIGNDSDLETIYKSGVKNAFICIGFMGNSLLRQKKAEQLKKIGFNIPVIIDPSAVISKDALIGEGSFVGKGAVINADVKIGRHTIINTCAVVEHDCTVGDFSHISVGAVLCGGVTVGENSFIGASSTIIQQKQVGNDVIIGAAGIVLKNVENGTKAVGVIK